MQNDLRAELIKQFPSEVIEMTDRNGESYYACPTCKRAIATGTEKCHGCNQMLSWDNIRKENVAKGIKKARLEFELPIDFAKGDCRKCPLSYIGRSGDENVYECPLQQRGSCKLEIIEE